MKNLEKSKDNLSNKCFQNSIGLIHKTYLSQLKTSKKYTASTKTKSEVQGGGRKPWKQKGTGQARAGSIRSPLWVGGGVIFGPKPRRIVKKINKKEKILAILFALYFKNCIIYESHIINSLTKMFYFEIHNTIFNNSIKNYNDYKNASLKLYLKTKLLLNYTTLIKLDHRSSKILFILDNCNKDLWLATRNIKNIEIASSSTVNLKQILNAKYIVIYY